MDKNIPNSSIHLEPFYTNAKCKIQALIQKPNLWNKKNQKNKPE